MADPVRAAILGGKKQSDYDKANLRAYNSQNFSLHTVLFGRAY
jgi:hypothetical protein